MINTPVKPLSPSVERVAQHYANLIQRKVLLPANPLPSIRDIAKDHGLSFGAARSAIVRLEEMQLVRRIHGSGTYVREPEPEDVGARPEPVERFVDFIAPSRPIVWGRFLGDLERLLYEQATQLVMRQKVRDSNAADISQAPRAVIANGLLGEEQDSSLKSTYPKSTRRIGLFRSETLSHGWHQVDLDYGLAFRMATEYLLEQGHRRIGLVLKRREVAADWPHTKRKRLMQHTQAILGAGHAMREADLKHALQIHYNTPINNDPSVIPVDEANVNAMAQWLKDRDAPTAVIAIDYRMIGVRMAAARINRQIDCVAIGGSCLNEAADLPCVDLQQHVAARHVARLVAASEDELDGVVQRILVKPQWVEGSR